ncbi:MORN repeat-containing protein 5 [Nowakowskiella sp. JEL0407]|nr:MORN repeat-containing protein 5 [Nowakowskiella sp. JEL0407]
MAFFGSPFQADVVNGRIEGKGVYTFPDGNMYTGFFKDGQFHGKGTLHFKNGGKFEAEWNKGKSSQGRYTFKDGLEYKLENWDYCTDKDRRFYSERVSGFRHGKPQLTNDISGPPEIPVGTYDVGDGYYKLETNSIFTYSGEFVRNPDESEQEWIVGNCRVGE